MFAHTRAVVAAAAHALITGRKVAGIFDHSIRRDLKIAAESRGEQLQGYDGERAVKFAGTLPEIYDAGNQAFISMQIDGTKAHGHDRSTASAYNLQVTDHIVQLYDHAEKDWFTYDVRDAESGQGYHRGAETSA